MTTAARHTRHRCAPDRQDHCPACFTKTLLLRRSRGVLQKGNTCLLHCPETCKRPSQVDLAAAAPQTSHLRSSQHPFEQVVTKKGRHFSRATTRCPALHLLTQDTRDFQAQHATLQQRCETSRRSNKLHMQAVACSVISDCGQKSKPARRSTRPAVLFLRPWSSAQAFRFRTSRAPQVF